MSDAGLGARFALAALATWRVTHLLASEDGPADAVVRLRMRLGAGRVGGLMDCFQCVSVWVAAPASLYVSRDRRDIVPAWLALSAAACLLQRRKDEWTAFEPIANGGEPHGMLWPEASGT